MTPLTTPSLGLLDGILQLVPGQSRQEKSEALRERLCTVVQANDRLQMESAELLAVVKHGGFWREWGHDSFRACVEALCSFSLRKAQHLIDIYRTLVEHLALPRERLLSLHWSKVALVTRAMTPANADAVLHDVEQLSYGALKRKYGRKKQAAHDKERSEVARFRLSRSEMGHLREALAKAAAATGHGGETDNLSWIVKQFLAPSAALPPVVAPPAVAAPPISRSSDWRRPRPAECVFYVHPDVWEQLCCAVAQQDTVLLSGPSGCGKSKLCYVLADAYGQRLEVFHCGAMSDPRSTLIGTTHFNRERGTWFSPSRFIRAVTTAGSMLMMDELSRARADAYNILLPLLDDQGCLALDESEEGAVVRRAPGVVFLCTMNEGAEYTGTEKLDRALLNRCAVTITIDFPPPDKEATLLKQSCPALAESDTRRLLQLAVRQRALARDGEFPSGMISTRQLIAAGRQVVAGVRLDNAIRYCILEHFPADGGDLSERTKLAQLFQKG